MLKVRFLVIPILIMIFITILSIQSSIGISNNRLNVIVTFPNLAEDIKPILCSGDKLLSIAPPGVDPHNYQLTVDDIKKLKLADVIVSTGHTPFEVEIRNLVNSGEVNAVLIEIPKIPGIRILTNPATGQKNLHMPIYDPENYKIFITHVADIFSKLRPEFSKEYKVKAQAVANEVTSLVSSVKKMNVVAAADVPFTQYAVTWLGIDIKYFVIREPELPASPKDIENIKSGIENGTISLVVVTKPVRMKASESLISIANKYDVPILYVYSPLCVNSTLIKLKDIVQQISKISKPTYEHEYISSVPYYVQWVLIMASAAITYGLLSSLISARRLYFLSAASAHGALLAVVLAIPISRIVGILNEYIWSILLGLVLIYYVGYLISRGVDPDVATGVFTSMTASLSIIAMYFVLTQYSINTDLWAIILGDPLLASWHDTLFATIVMIITIISIFLTYREQVCIGVERDCTILSGVNVALYDWLTYTLLGLATIALIKVVGFVLEHVLILLPAAIAIQISRSSREVLIVSVLVSLFSSILGLFIAIAFNLSPSGIAGVILFLIYVFIFAVRRRA